MKKKNECGNDHSGSYMVRRNLHSIHKYAAMLMEMISENDEIESWMEHKISVAKAAISDVKDAFSYDKEEGEESDENDIKITVLDGDDMVNTGQMGLNKMLGSCGGANETKTFLGSGAINEKRQLITNNSNMKVVVESVKREGNIIRVKTKSGKAYEYLPQFGAELEMLRCEGYNIKIKK